MTGAGGRAGGDVPDLPAARPADAADPSPSADRDRPGETGPSSSGADLARQALAAARARNAAARAARSTRRGGSAASGADGVRRLRRRRWSGPGADTARDPQPLGAMVRAWIAQADGGGEVVKARLFAQWADIVGADIAAHARPVELVDAELIVQAESTAWSTQLRLLAPGIVKKINTALGRGTVTRIRTKGPAAPSWRFGNRHIPGRGPRDTYG